MTQLGQVRVTALICTLLLLAFLPAFAETTPECEGFWLGRDGSRLPFCNDEEVLEFLREADVVATKQLGVGINRPFRLDLERDGVKARAIFRTVSKPDYRIIRNSSTVFRDSYIFEVAAYEVSRLLGLSQVPPVVLREVDGQSGSVQLWVEEAKMEAERMREALPPASPASWHRQRQLMVFFDQLIDNFDRNPGNILMDTNGKVWFVDHTRSFRRYPFLASPKDMKIVDRDTFLRLKSLDPKEIESRLDPLLESVEIDALLKRRSLLIELVEKMVAERGEAAILLDLGPPEPSSSKLADLDR